jgi:putative membrane-bound dehydrogenase-like protein
MMKYSFLAAFILVLTGMGCEAPKYTDALEPEEALKHFRLREGFRMELFAAEPDVQDPVEMIFDEEGNAYVIEMPDYPFKPEPGAGAGKIKVLQDTNSDGRIDRAILFADSLSEATSMLWWKKGLIVTSAPYILYLKDTTGDLVADSREILFSGFFANNSEAQITSLRFGVDNWIYAANNGQVGEVTFHRNPDAPPLSMAGSDFRFRLDRDQFELESGTAQFGLTLDDWGNRFVTQNTLHIRQVVIPRRYLHRQAHMSSTASMANISDHDLEMFQITSPPYWRAERTRRRQQQYAEQKLDRVEYAEDHFTGCSGGTIYDGDAFPSEYYGNVFTGDVAGNLVHRDVLVAMDDEPVFSARRVEGEEAREFLTSTDPWFRPASFTVGPDGFLYVIDMYRQHIETPLSIPEDLKAEMDFLAGSDRGRVYRIVPENHSGKRIDHPALGKMPVGDVASFLAHPNRWWRLQAQKILLERQDTSVVPTIKKQYSQHADPRVRVHALYVLEGLSVLDPSFVRQAMHDTHPGVRKNGLILAERYPELLPDILDILNDTAVQVVFQAVLTAGQFTGTKVDDSLAKALVQHGDDPWFRTAVLSARSSSSVSLLQKLIRQYSFFDIAAPWKISLLEQISYAAGTANELREVDQLLTILSSPALEEEQNWQLAGVRGLKEGMQRSPSTDAITKELLEKIQIKKGEEIPEALTALKNIVITKSAL